MQDTFRHPEHIILIGASDHLRNPGGLILQNLLGTPFQNKITPVNPKYPTVAGLKSLPDLSKTHNSPALVVAAVPHENYDALLKTCHKKHLTDIILIQDWDKIPQETLQTIEHTLQKHRNRLNILACNTDGIQIPSSQLNISTRPTPTEGRTALLTGNRQISSQIKFLLKKSGQGISQHTSLHYPLNPSAAADWLNHFAHGTHTQTAIIQHNPHENQRNLFSAIRHFTRQTPLILYIPDPADDTTVSIFHSLSRHCNFLPVFNSSDLESAIHAAHNKLPVIQTLSILTDTPSGWLYHSARQQGLTTYPGQPSQYPDTAAQYLSAATQAVQTKNHQALLVHITPTGSPDEHKLTQALHTLARQNSKPILISSPQANSSLQFDTPEKALRTIALSNQAHTLNKEQQKTAAPKKGRLKTPQTQNIRKAIEAHNLPLLAETLHLPPYRPTQTGAVQLRYTRHPQYGYVLTAGTQGKTTAALPPFTTLDTEHLHHFTRIPTPTLNQILHTLNHLSRQEQHIGDILISGSSGQYSTDFAHITPLSPHNKHKTNKAAQTLEQAAAKMQTAAAYLSQKNPAAAQFLRNTGEAAAELLHVRQDSPKPPQNVLAPYPEKHSAITLPNGETLNIRPYEPEDAEAKQQFIRELTPQARYTRFMTRTNELPAPTLARLSNIDYHTESAWIAHTADGQIAAVARYAKIDPDECSFGITLQAAYRGTGLARHMMQHIIKTAAQHNYKTMSADILKENTAMIKLAEKSGFTITASDTDNTLVHATLQLPKSKTTTKTNKNLRNNHKIT